MIHRHPFQSCRIALWFRGFAIALPSSECMSFLTPTMKISRTVLFLLFAWVILFALSFILPRTVEATGDGFTRGLNRLSIFFGWQIAAFVVAILTALLSWRRSKPQHRFKWAGYIPAGTHLGLFLFVVGFVMIGRFNKPPASEAPPPKATTAPAATAIPVPGTAPVLAAPATSTFQGIYRSGFEQSHFYTMDGDGPWWLEASEEVWETLQSYHVDGPGRSGGVTVALIVQGHLGAVDDGIRNLTKAEKTIHVTTLDSIRALSPEEFELVLKSIRKSDR